MPSIQQKSKPAISTLSLFAFLFAFLAAIAIHPAIGHAEEPQPLPQLSFEPGGYDFGLQPVNSGSSQANFQLRNVGSEGVQVNSIEITGPGSDAFWTNTNCFGIYLQPNETCYVQVYFGPRDTNEYAVQLRANTGPYSFTANLTGTGGRAILAPASNPTDFGVAKVGSAGTTHEVTVTNVGNMPGGAFIAVISGGAVGSFQLLDENCTGHMLAPAASCTLQIRFRPLSEGVKTATLGLFGESDGGTQIVLTGVGSVPDAAPEPPVIPASGPVIPSGAAASATSPPAKVHKGKRLRRRHRRAFVDDARLLSAPRNR